MTPRELARQYRCEHPELPADGYVIIYRGEVAGWTSSITEPRGWLSGCLAVPAYYNARMYIADGGNYQDGAERWEPMDPRFEPVKPTPSLE